MADAKKTDTAADGDAAKPKKKLLLIIIIAVLILVLGGGGAAFFLTKKKAVDDEEGADEEDAAPAKVVVKKKKKDAHASPPVFAKLDAFVVKLQGENGQENYVQAVPELKLAEAPLADQIKQYTPEIRHKILLIMASKNAAELSTPEGMQKLANQIRVAINTVLTQEKPRDGDEKLDEDNNAPVMAVFLSSLIVQ